jgi:CRISPR-associated protein Cas2
VRRGRRRAAGRHPVLTERRTYLVAYDIRAPRRLARVHRALSKVGYRLQYSVFAVDLDDRGLEQLAARLRRLISEKEDDVRFYLVPINPRGAWHGPQAGADALAVSGSPAAMLAERLARQNNDGVV